MPLLQIALCYFFEVKTNEMKTKMKDEMCPVQDSDQVQQLLPGRLIGRARDFDSRGVGSNPAPATKGIIA